MPTEFGEGLREEIKLSKTHTEVLARVGITKGDITKKLDLPGGRNCYTLPSGEIEEGNQRFLYTGECTISETGKLLQLWMTRIVTHATEGNPRAISVALFYRKEGFRGRKLELSKMCIYGQLEEVGVHWDQEHDVMIEIDAKTGMMIDLRLDRDAARLTSLVLTKGNEKIFPGPFFVKSEKKDKFIKGGYYVPSPYEDKARQRILSCLGTNWGLPIGYDGRLRDDPEQGAKRFATSPKPFEYKRTFVRKGDRTIETVGLFPKF